MRRSLALSTTLALTGALALSAVVAAQDPTEIKVWFHGGQGVESDTLHAQVEAFNAGQSDIVAKITEIPGGAVAGSGYNDAVNAAAVAGDLPCILDLDGPNLYNYAWAGYLMPLDDFMSEELWDDLLPSLIDQGIYNDKMYAISQYDSGLAVVGRKSLLEAAEIRIPTGISDAWTFDEFSDALDKLKALGETEWVLDLKLNYGAGEWFTYGFSPIVQGFGGDLIDRSDYLTADGVVNGEEAVAALTFLQGLVENGYVNPTPADDSDYVSGKAALGWVGHWMTNDYYAEFGDDMVIIPMPNLGARQATGMGTWAWSVTSQCDQPEAAWTFMEYLLDPQQILDFTALNGAVPGRFSALEMSDLYGEGGRLDVFAQQLGGGVAVPRPITPAYPAITSAFYQAVDDIFKGGDVQTELDAVADAIEADIEANSGYPVIE